MKQTRINTIQNQRIFVSPLNWGLGHVYRLIPILKILKENNNEIIICCEEQQEEFFRHYFPEIWYIPLAGYPFRFTGNGKWTKDILNTFFSLSKHLSQEKKRVEELVEKFNPSLLISDQRFGFLSSKVKSIIISHQLQLPVSKWNFIAQLWNKFLLNQFDEIWIPDDSQLHLSGKLSKNKWKKVHFIGICSRFQAPTKENDTKKYQYVGIVSGPPPYNQQLFSILYQKFTELSIPTAIIAPQAIISKNKTQNNCELFTNLSPSHFEEIIDNGEIIVSRNGYSTLMDLVQRQQKGILIPTKGQAEQLYLAKHLKKHNLFTFKTEEEFRKMEL